MTDKKRINILYTNIGRGHPFYLDGICEEIRRNHSDKIDLRITDVFELSSSLSLLLWKLIRIMYKVGSQGGLLGKIYSAIRNNKRTDSYGSVEKILARGIRDYLKKNSFPTLVAHPMLIPMISDLTDVYYQHGELAVPEMVLVNGAKKIFVPSVTAKSTFCQKGVGEDKIRVTGLCIEQKLKENSVNNFEKRLARLKSNKELIGAFFTSGAEPIGHIDKIIRMLFSLEKNNQKAIVFCKSGGRLEKVVRNKINVEIFNPEKIENDIRLYFNKRNILIVAHNNREEENSSTESLFKYFDYFVSPSHERTNWALGLGIPMFLLHPLIGPFSPLNRKLLLKYETAFEIIDNEMADSFAEKLRQLSINGDLTRMAKNGFDRFSLDGFGTIAESLTKLLVK